MSVIVQYAFLFGFFGVLGAVLCVAMVAGLLGAAGWFWGRFLRPQPGKLRGVLEASRRHSFGRWVDPRR